MSDLLRNIIRFFIFIFIQVYVLDQIHLYQYIIPYIYFLFILWLPFSVSRFGLLIIGFITGLTLDYFTSQMGVHTAACVLVAYVRPFLLNILLPKDMSDINYREPSPKGMGWAPYGTYVLVLTALHHTYMFFLQRLQLTGFFQLLMKIILTTIISILLILIAELIFQRRMRYKTNAA